VTADFNAASGDASTGAAGQYNGTLTVTDRGRTDGLTCSKTASDSVMAYDDLDGTANLTGACDLKIGYGSTVSGGSGAYTYAWSFTPGTGAASNPNGAGGTFTATTGGTYIGAVTIADARTDGASCSITRSDSAETWAKLGVSADLTGGCSSSFSYAATVSGGSPAGVAYAWTFPGIGSSAAQSGDIALGQQPPGGTGVSGSVQVVDLRGDGAQCAASSSDNAQVFSPIAVHLTPSATSATCADAITYSATITGGPASPILTWNGASCSGASCTVREAGFCGTRSLSLAVSDGSGICAAAASETETYTKVTTVSASDN
jgi:hypothetical protein